MASRTLTATSLLFMSLLACETLATTPAMPTEHVCPLTGEHFMFTDSYGSYTSFGVSLDLEPLVMGQLRATRVRVPQCPDSDLPLYKPFTEREMEQIRSFIVRPEWATYRAAQSAFYLVSKIEQLLGEPPQAIADALLKATWNATPDNKELLVDQAIEAWTKAADAAATGSRQWVIATWLTIDLNRQQARFSQAEMSLNNLLRTAGDPPAPITADMVSAERRLINERVPLVAATPEKH